MNQGIINVAAIEEWITENVSEKSVEATLIAKGYETGLVKEYLFEFKRLRRAKNHLFGLMFLSFGALIGILALVVEMHK